ncbi:class I SAM-dependent methyltransferase [bacterium]|nr:class I SAM-dependent methyltransferase [bacterium]
MPEFVNPIEILNQIGLKANMIAADFGSGSGGWTIPLARKLEDGQVFAVDIQEEPLSVLESRAKLQGISNIQKIIANVEEKIPGISDLTCDLVLVTDLLFQIEDKKGVFEEAKRILKPGGKILVVEWIPGVSLGPKGGAPSKEEVKEITKNLGFRLEKEFKAGDYHFGFVFVKP